MGAFSDSDKMDLIAFRSECENLVFVFDIRMQIGF